MSRRLCMARLAKRRPKSCNPKFRCHSQILCRHSRAGGDPALRHSREGQQQNNRHSRVGSKTTPRHSRVGGSPNSGSTWIPACTGMTKWCAGMTTECTAMKIECAGMAKGWVPACAGMTQERETTSGSRLHQPDEPFEQIVAVGGTGGCLGVVLNREDRFAFDPQALV